MMGWLIERGSPGGAVQYMAMYRDLQGHQRSAGTFAGKRAAKAACKEAEVAQSRGRVGDPKRGRQSFRSYVEDEWLPHHVMEASTREGYVYKLYRHIMPEFGGRPMREILPFDVRAWVLRLQENGVKPPTIRYCKVILDAILTTALNDQVTFLHAGKGVKTPPVAKKAKRIITSEQFDRLYAALPAGTMQLLVETDIESGLRWGELTELRVKDLDIETGVITVARVVVHLKSKDRPLDARFLVKHYPKDKEWRQVKLAKHILAKLVQHIEKDRLGPEDLLFLMPSKTSASRRRRPATLPDPAILGVTAPNDKGRQYAHGTLTAYQAGKCRCDYCKDAVASYRAARRAEGKDDPRPVRQVQTDGHIPNDWFRRQVWAPALKAADLGFRITPHGLRRTHASWLLAGGANLQVVKERLGHSSITTTEQYLHALPGAHDAALDALDVVRAPAEARPINAGPSVTTSAGGAVDEDPRDAELAELRSMVDTFKNMLGALGNTA